MAAPATAAVTEVPIADDVSNRQLSNWVKRHLPTEVWTGDHNNCCFECDEEEPEGEDVLVFCYFCTLSHHRGCLRDGFSEPQQRSSLWCCPVCFDIFIEQYSKAQHDARVAEHGIDPDTVAIQGNACKLSCCQSVTHAMTHNCHLYVKQAPTVMTTP